MIGRLLLAAAAGLLAWAGFSPQAGSLNDAQIAHIAYTAGLIDVAAGKQALAKSRDKAVRAFAEEMVRDHAAVNDEALALVAKLGVTPQDNPTSVALNRDAAAELKKLASLDGDAFDRAYVKNEIDFHRTVNAALRTSLIPSAANGELKTLLETGLRLFSEHQIHAEHLATQLG
jgi:putative membrane protein